MKCFLWLNVHKNNNWKENYDNLLLWLLLPSERRLSNDIQLSIKGKDETSLSLGCKFLEKLKKKIQAERNFPGEFSCSWSFGCSGGSRGGGFDCVSNAVLRSTRGIVLSMLNANQICCADSGGLLPLLSSNHRHVWSELFTLRCRNAQLHRLPLRKAMLHFALFLQIKWTISVHFLSVIFGGKQCKVWSSVWCGSVNIRESFLCGFVTFEFLGFAEIT